MRTEYKYKKQGDGRDSWEVREYDDDELISAYMVYEDPEKLPVPKVDVIGLVKSMSANEISQLKELLK